MSSGAASSLATGIDVLDRKLGGGVPLGGVVALSAPPASQSELFLYEFATTRETVYLSTVRTPETVEEALDAQEIESTSIETVHVDPGRPLAHASELVDELAAGTNVVVDPMGPLEEGQAAAYRRFLAELKHRTIEDGNVVFLHCLREPEPPDKRRLTNYVADIVFELETETEGQSVVNRLTVPKFRGGQSVEDVIKLDLTSEVEVDVSRNIV